MSIYILKYDYDSMHKLKQHNEIFLENEIESIIEEKDTIIQKLTEDLLKQIESDDVTDSFTENASGGEKSLTRSKKVLVCGCDGSGNTDKKKKKHYS